MKYLLTASVAVALALGPIGCNKSPEGGQPGTPNTFKLAGPDPSPSMKPGEIKSFEITIDRGSDFKRGLKLDVKGTEKLQAKIEPSSVGEGQTPKLNLILTAAPDAPEGKQTVQIHATPEGGGTAVDYPIEVTIKK